MPAVLTADLLSVLSSIRLRIVCTAMLFLCAGLAQEAEACRYQDRPMADKIAQAPVIAIGHIETVENGLAILRVQQAVKGLAEGQQTVEIETGRTSCHHHFAAGQRWLYMGTGYPSGSMLLEDEYARRHQENIDFVARTFGGGAAGQSLALGGSISNSCAPWDGAAMALELSDGTTAYIYSSMQDIGDTPRHYALDNQTKRGSGAVMSCHGEEKPCAAAKGEIYLHRAGSGEIEGRLESRDGEYTVLKNFRVKENRKEALCG